MLPFKTTNSKSNVIDYPFQHVSSRGGTSSNCTSPNMLHYQFLNKIFISLNESE